MKFFRFVNELFPDLLTILERVEDPRDSVKITYPLSQVFLATALMFALRHRSLRDFCISMSNKSEFTKNVSEVFGIESLPTDDGIRKILEPLSAKENNGVIRVLNERLRTQKIFKDQKILNQYELVSMDGTGHLSSSKVFHSCCLIRHTEEKDIFLHHQLVFALTNRNARYTIPMLYEPIRNLDELKEFEKNDCEINAAKRGLFQMREAYPQRNFLFTGDNLFAVQSVIEIIHGINAHYLFTAKPERNKEVYFMREYLADQVAQLTTIDPWGHRRIYSWLSNVNLVAAVSKTNESMKTNFLEYTEVDSEGQIIYESAWITDLPLNNSTVIELAAAGRARFSIENRVFNILKNHGFNVEHNFGHAGNLPEVFFGLALMALLLTQMFVLWTGALPDIRDAGSIRKYFLVLQVLTAKTKLTDLIEPIGNMRFCLENKIEYNTG